MALPMFSTLVEHRLSNYIFSLLCSSPKSLLVLLSCFSYSENLIIKVKIYKILCSFHYKSNHSIPASVLPIIIFVIRGMISTENIYFLIHIKIKYEMKSIEV